MVKGIDSLKIVTNGFGNTKVFLNGIGMIMLLGNGILHMKVQLLVNSIGIVFSIVSPNISVRSTPSC